MGISNAEPASKSGYSRDRQWRALLAQLDIAIMTDRFIERVAQLPDYGPGSLSDRDLRQVAQPTFTALVRSLEVDEDDVEATATTRAIATELGSARARAGVPLESLMSAIRLDFSILWSCLLEVAGPQDASVLVSHTARVWDVVDAFATRTRTTYLVESQRMAQEAASRREDYVSGIFADDPPSSEAIRLLAARLGIPPDARLAVACALGDDVPALRRAIVSARLVGGELLTHPIGGGIVVFWVLDQRPGSALHILLNRLRHIRCGLVEQVDGLAELRDHARLARDLATLLGPDETRALTLGSSWPRIARERLARAGLPTAADVERALEACAGPERERILQVIQAYLRTGSVNQTAAVVFSHRNTVMKRMNRFRELTGIDVTIPVQAARLVVAWA